MSSEELQTALPVELARWSRRGRVPFVKFLDLVDELRTFDAVRVLIADDASEAVAIPGGAELERDPAGYYRLPDVLRP